MVSLGGVALVRRSGGIGFGVDFGMAGVGHGREDHLQRRHAQPRALHQVKHRIPAGPGVCEATRLRVTRFLDPDQVRVRDVFENEDFDGDRDPDLRER